MKNELTESDAQGMTVNERLWHAGLIDAFDQALAQADEERLNSILAKIYFTQEQINEIVPALLKKPTG